MKVRCRYYWDPEVVKYFEKDSQIRRTTAKSLFRKRLHDGTIKCYKFSKSHKHCSSYTKWKESHPAESRAIIEESSRKPKAVFIPMNEFINVHGRDVKITGGIKSIDPPCLEEAMSHGAHPFTCLNCAKQERELKNTLHHRLTGRLQGNENRLGQAGFNKRYARKGELEEALNKEGQLRKAAQKQVRELARVQLAPKDVEDCLMDSCITGDEQKLVVDLVRLFSSGTGQKKPVQILVLKNLVSKLLRNNNHHYVSLIKDLSGVFKSELGPTNYSLLAEVFGLARQTTESKHSMEERLDPGINFDALSKAAALFKKSPVNEASDGARALRYLQARKFKDGSVRLIGQGWNPDIHSWKSQEMAIPRKDPREGDKDDFSALKRVIENLIKRDALSKTVSIHNLSPLTSMEKSSIIYCMWPTIEKGYTGKHLLNYWQELRRLCFYENGEKRKNPIHLLGYSTDSAGFSLSAAVQMMTPNLENINNGVLYLGLGLQDERFLAPYYWFLPAICYLDYDHEQRLFMKNLKYETRELTFWKEEGSSSRNATIQHLKDLRHRCQEKGMDSGLKATDLILIYFCDQNSDACEHLFTEQIADLLDEYVPGSQGTSLYIRAVFHLIEPFRKPNFGGPSDVQKSVSCGITVLGLWRKVLELRKLPLNSKPGAKKNPSHRGNFITRGCYITAEILFAAATLHQLAMFLHFPDEGEAWASPYNSGTKSTERIIGELQGKTTELQSLDSQPSFGDMLDKSAKVQFNVNAKRRVAAAGVNVKASSKRKKLAFAFKSHETSIKSKHQYPNTYLAFKEQQKQAHREGVKKGQDLFERFMPQSCVNLVKENNCWDTPYTFENPSGLEVMNGKLPENYTKLDLNVSVGSLAEDTQLELNEDHDEEECENSQEDYTTAHDEILETGEDELENEMKTKQGKKWMISKFEDGKLNYIHINQAIKVLLPREYIARCRQKRHWASKFLPGKEPLNPEHDVVLFGDVAITKVSDGKSFYLIGRVERIESTKDGTGVLSFKLKDNPPVRVRCSVYDRREDGCYEVGDDIVLTSWRSPRGILGPVQLLPMSGGSSTYSLHETSRTRLEELGHNPYGESSSLPDNDGSEHLEQQNELEEGFYEVEEVLQRRLNKNMTYEYRVRFKGYGPEDDMWLPASAFNRSVTFESTSRFGRKQKYKTDGSSLLLNTSNDETSGEKSRSCKRMKADDCGTQAKNGVAHHIHDDQKSTPLVKSGSSDGKRQKAPSRKKTRSKVSKGKHFRQGLHASKSGNNSQTATMAKSHENAITISSNEENRKLQQMRPLNEHVNRLIVEDIKRRDDNFATPRRKLAEAELPIVDVGIQTYNIKPIISEDNLKPQDPLTVDRVPPMSVLNQSMKALREVTNKKTRNRRHEDVVEYPLYGCFTLEGLRILTRYDKIRNLARQVPEEIRWMATAFEGLPERDRKLVAEALLDRWNTSGSVLVDYKGYKITSQDLSVLCCERYLNDEVMNLLIMKYCEEANERHQEEAFTMLPSYVTSVFGTNSIHHLCASVDMSKVDTVFLPTHLHGCHWGLTIFYVKEHEVQFDDGYHCPITNELEDTITGILKTFHQATGLQCFESSSWSRTQRFRIPMPDQPPVTATSRNGTGSCGVGVLCCVRDICNGCSLAFTWNFDDAPQLRAQLMVELLGI